MRGNTTPPVAAGALSDKRLPISGGNPPPLAMGRNFTEEGGDRFRKIPLPELVIETNISGGDIRKD